jgi:hypothetical protein
VIVEIVDGGKFAEALPTAVSEEPGIVIVMPSVDARAAAQSARLMVARAGTANGIILEIRDTTGAGFVALANASFLATRSRYFGYVAQDAFAGRLWLERAVAALEKTGKGLLAFNDGKWMGALAGFGLVRRDWAARNYDGALFHAGYVGHYADVELTLLAMNEGQLCYDANCVLVEVDWDKDRKSVSATDRALYRQRAAAGFDGRVSSPRLLGLFS